MQAICSPDSQFESMIVEQQKNSQFFTTSLYLIILVLKAFYEKDIRYFFDIVNDTGFSNSLLKKPHHLR